MASPRETHGIPEVPSSVDQQSRVFMQQMRNAVVRLQGSKASARPVTNLRVTPVGFGNVIDYTRSDGDSYTLWWSLAADSTKANPIPIGQQSRYTHTVGRDGVKVFYWVQAIRDNGQNSKLVGAKFGVTLLSNAAVTIPDPPPPSDDPVFDDGTGRLLIG